MIVDAVGISHEDLTDTVSLEKKPSVSFEKLLEDRVDHLADPYAPRLAEARLHGAREGVGGQHPGPDGVESVVGQVGDPVRVPGHDLPQRILSPPEEQIRDRILRLKAGP